MLLNELKEISICFPHQAIINNYPFQLCLTHKHTVRHKRTIISIHYSEAAVFSIREMNPLQMICINTCQCFVSHWYLMNFKHWLFFSGNFPCSHKLSSPDRVEVLSLSSSGSVLAGWFRSARPSVHLIPLNTKHLWIHLFQSDLCLNLRYVWKHDVVFLHNL